MVNRSSFFEHEDEKGNIAVLAKKFIHGIYLHYNADVKHYYVSFGNRWIELNKEFDNRDEAVKYMESIIEKITS